MKRTAEEAAQTRQEILDAALDVFSDKGFHAARLQDIATAAGVTRGAVYHHFGNKAGLYDQLIAAGSEGGNTIVADAIGAGGTIVEICERILVSSFEQIATDGRARKTMQLYLFKSDFSAELSHITEQLEQAAVTDIQAIAGYMQMGIGQGDLQSDLDPEDAARAFVAFQNGVIQLWLLNTKAFSLVERAPHLARAFLNGLAA